jgi:CRP/FNR family cyclic AMP-dependent transcriptional regulator
MNLVNLFKHSKDTTYFMEGSMLFQQGDPGDFMFVLLEGKVEVQVQMRPVFIAGPGDIIGEMALIDSKKRSASAVAKTDCRVVSVDEKRFIYMVNQTPYFALHVMQVLADRLRNMDQRIPY